MWVLPLLGYLGLVLGFLFLTLAIASGLYYLSELVEEHTVLSKKLLYRLIYAVITIQVLLALIDSFPKALSAFSIASHVIYSLNLRRFPVVKLTDPVFLASCVLVLANHYLWFKHFSSSDATGRGNGRYSYLEQKDIPSFTEIASFFGLNVWLVPFALFVSLSAGENVLPSMGSEYATGAGSSFITPGQTPSIGAGVGSSSYMDVHHQQQSSGHQEEFRGRTRHKRSNTQTGMAKAAVNGMRDWVGETGELMGFWRGDRTRPL
ncbi:hypothetical protein Slin15195_G113440 [Septoria linicola]|uniref:DUF396-domain-containing protein n=1 Tax=Septoria linicola TaxID=215465 RepID=A0A9Q9AZM7_9PEZI|nr:hypothetical protein Slin14017_G111800 [Septoria linicola]USW58025.1 hypothetical protein Slin15195_G113440 [Septoria linicola]